MKFQQISKSKRHTKFYDACAGEIFFARGFSYMKASCFEDDNDVVNAVQLDGIEKGELVFFEEDEDIDILKREVVINYEANEVLSWI
jgi:hypothetical protein